MPAAKNMKELIEGSDRPIKHNVEQKDAISCFYCHQIGFVKQAHQKNINFLSKKPAGYKVSMFGSLEDADDSDKHEMLNNPIYKKNVCLGCHSHKRNSHDVLIFDAMLDNQDSTGCLKCHMPYISGGVEKTNKRARLEHRSHLFPGVHSLEMVKDGIDIDVSTKDNTIIVTLKNKMPHSLIIQAARLKYLEITLRRDNKVIWRNYKKSPLEDKKGSFEIEFLDENNKPVIIPAFAYKRGFVNNLKAKETRDIEYKVDSIKKGDVISVSMYTILAKPSCNKELDLKDKSLSTPILMKQKIFKK
jgi:hypothetical protein